MGMEQLIRDIRLWEGSEQFTDDGSFIYIAETFRGSTVSEHLGKRIHPDDYKQVFYQGGTYFYARKEYLEKE